MDLWIQNSSIVSKKAAVVSDQPTATRIGIDILKKGGNAADAAIGVMAAVSVVQPLSCGLGGDCHCLFFRNSDKSIHSINGSGRTGKNATLKKVKEAGISDIYSIDCANSGLWVSVPGTVAGMCDIVKHFGSGKVTMKDILDPAVKLAEDGVPMPFKHAALWNTWRPIYMNSKNANDLLVDGKSPAPGDILYAPKLAKRFRDIAESGPESFYCGQTAKNIVEAVQSGGGVLTLEDLEDHLLHRPSEVPSDAVSIEFHGFRIWEMKPNTMGIVALVALNILKGYDLKAFGHNSAEYVHILAEAIKFAYLESWDYLCDPDYCCKQLETLLTEEAAQKLRNKIDLTSASQGKVDIPGGNTSYVAVVDEEGNGCSFICSVSSGFGTGIIPNECGFPMHDRAKQMNLDENTSNVFGPRKLPLHSIIPVLVTDPQSKELLAVMGVIGRWMQPQGHVQVLLNMILFGMDPQVALNQPRFFRGDPRYYLKYEDNLDTLCLESGIDTSIIPVLESKGHTIKVFGEDKRILFGNGHIISRSVVFDKSSAAKSSYTWWSGADPRSDGCAIGY